MPLRHAGGYVESTVGRCQLTPQLLGQLKIKFVTSFEGRDSSNWIVPWRNRTCETAK